VPLLVITGAGTVTVRVRGALPVPPLLVAASVTLEVPAPVGVPEIKPEEVLTVKPAGNPDAPKLVGELVAVIWYEKAVPTVPLAVPLLVIAGAAMIMVRVKGALPVPPPLVALSVTFEVPAVAEVPEIKPEAVFTASPLGNPDAPKPVGEFVAVI
jgi:hypothetical protein